MPQLCGDSVEQVVQNITEGIGSYVPSQHFVYYIYENHESNVPIIGTRFDVYRFVKSVSGKKVEGVSRLMDSHTWALTHKSSMAWFFSDDMFE